MQNIFLPIPKVTIVFCGSNSLKVEPHGRSSPRLLQIVAREGEFGKFPILAIFEDTQVHLPIIVDGAVKSGCRHCKDVKDNTGGAGSVGGGGLIKLWELSGFEKKNH